MAGPDESPLLPPSAEEEVFFKNYIPPARDAIHLPIHIFYIILASIVIMATLYAIIRPPHQRPDPRPGRWADAQS